MKNGVFLLGPDGRPVQEGGCAHQRNKLQECSIRADRPAYVKLDLTSPSS
jgi:hypothetical protein